MGFESQINEADEQIRRELEKLSEELVIRYYEPLFEEIKKIALYHMRNQNIEKIKLEPNWLYFESDGNFHDRSSPTNIKLVELSSLPACYKSDYKTDLTLRSTQYHSEMSYILNDFKRTVRDLVLS